jgi:hypothetical protein
MVEKRRMVGARTGLVGQVLVEAVGVVEKAESASPEGLPSPAAV